MNEFRFNGIRVLWPARGESEGAKYDDRVNRVLTLAIAPELSEIIYTAIDQNPDFTVEENELFWLLAVGRFWDKHKGVWPSPEWKPPFPIQDPNFKHLATEWKFVLLLVGSIRDMDYASEQIRRAIWDNNDRLEKLQFGLEKFLRAPVEQIMKQLNGAPHLGWNYDTIMQTIGLLELGRWNTRAEFDQFCSILLEDEDIVFDQNIEQLAAALWPMLMQAVEMAANQWRNDLSRILASRPYNSIWEVSTQGTDELECPDYW